MKKNLWKEYFSFTRRERYGVFILLTIIATFIILPFFWQKKFTKPVIDEDLQKQLIALESGKTDSSFSEANNNAATADDDIPVFTPAAAELFYFNPNTLDEAGLRRLGLPEKNIRTIINYRNKGGSFKTAEDIRKIYGLKKEDADRIIPYIKIKETPDEAALQNNSENKDDTNISSSIKQIDINTATKEEWEALPGIGEVLANRIIKFRYASGGFSSVYDVKKTYGLSDSTFNVIFPYLTIQKPDK